MHLLPNQLEALERAIQSFGWRTATFAILPDSSVTRIKCSAEPRFAFVVKVRGADSFGLHMAPGPSVFEETTDVRSFQRVVIEFSDWLGRVKAQVTVAQRERGQGDPPEWLTKVMPADHRTLLDQIASLQAEVDTISQMARLLWQTGDPLHAAVMAVFKAVGLRAEPTVPGATYDLTIHLGTSRLLIEVTGVEGAIQKKSNKIAQLLQAVQDQDQDAGDRLVLALNAHRGQPPDARKKEPPVTPDALALLRRLDVVIVPTWLLFDVWLQSRADPDGGRKRLEAIASLKAGVADVL